MRVEGRDVGGCVCRSGMCEGVWEWDVRREEDVNMEGSVPMHAGQFIISVWATD